MQAESRKTERVVRIRACKDSYSRFLHRSYDREVPLKFSFHVGEVFRCALSIDGRRVPGGSRAPRNILQASIVEKGWIIPIGEHAQQRKRRNLPRSIALKDGK